MSNIYFKANLVEIDPRDLACPMDWESYAMWTSIDFHLNRTTCTTVQICKQSDHSDYQTQHIHPWIYFQQIYFDRLAANQLYKVLHCMFLHLSDRKKQRCRILLNMFAVVFWSLYYMWCYMTTNWPIQLTSKYRLLLCYPMNRHHFFHATDQIFSIHQYLKGFCVKNDVWRISMHHA